MILSFLESIKYVGHLFPLAFLRVFVGYYYLDLALSQYGSDFLYRPKLAAEIVEWLPKSSAPLAYKAFVETFIIPNWQIFAYTIVGIEFAVAISFLLGFAVRPIAILASFLSINLMLLSGPESEMLYKLLFSVNLTFAWIGAGRCLGVDYFFYKRKRGLWW